MSFPPGGNSGGGFPKGRIGFAPGPAYGAKGAGAGLTRVLLQYITQYDKGNLEQLTKDLQALQQQQVQANQQLLAAATRQKSIEDEITRAKQARGNLDAQSQKALKSALDIQARARAEEQTLGRVSQATTAEVLKRERAFRAISGLTQLENAALLSEVSNQVALNGAKTQTQTLQQGIIEREAQINAVMEQGIALATMRAQLASQVKNLLLGAVGATVGGAIIGAVLYEPLQGLLNSVTSFARDIVDPAHKARDAIGELGKEINGMVDEQTLTRLAAAQKFIEAIRPTSAQGLFSGDVLGAAAQSAAYKDLIDTLTKYKDLLGGGVAQTQEQQQKDLALLLIQIDTLNRSVHVLLPGMEGYNEAVAKRKALGQPDFVGGVTGIGGVIDFSHYLGEAAGYLDDLDPSKVDETTTALQEAADAARDLAQELDMAAIEDGLNAVVDGINNVLDTTLDGIRARAEAGIENTRRWAENAIDSIRERADLRVDQLQKQKAALEVVDSRRTKNLQAALDALKDAGPSKRTKELADQIERLNDAQDKIQFRAQLAAIAEQRHAILLRERLRLSSKEIDLDNYKGKDRLIAIDALLARMQAQNEAQDRFNKLLDIQYQMQKGVRREQGETIAEFTSRRAQYYRGLLQQAAELQREGPQAELEAERDRTQVSIDLAELAAQRKKLIADRARKQFMESLQEQLRASQDRDRKELESRRESLQKQLAASRKADQDALEAKRQALDAQIDAVRKNAQRQIDAVNDTRDRQIAAYEDARDAAIDAARKAAEKAIALEEAKAENAKRWADFAETQRYSAAFDGARNIAELQRFGGALAGANFSEAYVQAQLAALGLDPATQATILANVRQLKDVYTRNFNRLSAPGGGVRGWWNNMSDTPHKDGGVFTLRNSQQNPFGSDIRHGEDGRDELGVILSHQVLRKLDQRGGAQALVGGDMIIQTGEDPYRARANWRREMISLIDERLNN